MFIHCVYFFCTLPENNGPPLFPFAVVTRDHFNGIASTFTRELIRTDGRNAQNRISLIWCTSHETASAPRFCDRGMCFLSIPSERFSIYDRHNVIYSPAVSAWIRTVAIRWLLETSFVLPWFFLQLNDSINSLHAIVLIYNSYSFAKISFTAQKLFAQVHEIVWCV